jgi:hypothetical protein
MMVFTGNIISPMAKQTEFVSASGERSAADINPSPDLSRQSSALAMGVELKRGRSWGLRSRSLEQRYVLQLLQAHPGEGKEIEGVILEVGGRHPGSGSATARRSVRVCLGLAQPDTRRREIGLRGEIDGDQTVLLVCLHAMAGVVEQRQVALLEIGGEAVNLDTHMAHPKDPFSLAMAAASFTGFFRGLLE